MRYSGFLMGFLLSLTVNGAFADVEGMEKILSDWEASNQEWQAAFEYATGDQKEDLIKTRPNPAKVALPLWNKTSQILDQPEALPAIVWFINHPEAIAGAFDATSQKKVMNSILSAIDKHHVESQGIGAVVPALAGTTNLRCRKILEKIRLKNPNPTDQGIAAMGLALHMQEHSGMRQDDPRINGIRLKYIREAIIKSYDESFGDRKVSDYTTELLYEINNLSLRRKAPAFELQTEDGTSVKIPDGKPTLLIFWSPKVPGSASLVAQASTLRSKHPNLEIRPVSYTPNDDTTQALGTAQTEGAGDNLIDKQGEVFKLYRIATVPTVYLLDSDGVIRMRGVPDMMFQAVLDQAMSSIKSAPSSTSEAGVTSAPEVLPKDNSPAQPTPPDSNLSAPDEFPTNDSPETFEPSQQDSTSQPPLSAPPLRPIPGM